MSSPHQQSPPATHQSSASHTSKSAPFEKSSSIRIANLDLLNSFLEAVKDRFHRRTLPMLHSQTPEHQQQPQQQQFFEHTSPYLMQQAQHQEPSNPSPSAMSPGSTWLGGLGERKEFGEAPSVPQASQIQAEMPRYQQEQLPAASSLMQQPSSQQVRREEQPPSLNIGQFGVLGMQGQSEPAVKSMLREEEPGHHPVSIPFQQASAQQRPFQEEPFRNPLWGNITQQQQQPSQGTVSGREWSQGQYQQESGFQFSGIPMVQFPQGQEQERQTAPQDQPQQPFPQGQVQGQQPAPAANIQQHQPFVTNVYLIVKAEDQLEEVQECHRWMQTVLPTVAQLTLIAEANTPAEQQALTFANAIQAQRNAQPQQPRQQPISESTQAGSSWAENIQMYKANIHPAALAPILANQQGLVVTLCGRNAKPSLEKCSMLCENSAAPVILYKTQAHQQQTQRPIVA